MERTYYPGYSVMSQEGEWDDHTRQIVRRRLGPFEPPQHLSGDQAKTLRAIVSVLVDDRREEILDYLVNHFGQKLGTDSGQAQRKKEVPPFKQLLRSGLEALDRSSQAQVHGSFAAATLQQQCSLLKELEQGNLQATAWSGIPQQDFFDLLLQETVSAYYSHPTVWSEIGYAGPAYPRGYMRSELGLTEPWEARRDGE